jgi:hypothetical protein
MGISREEQRRAAQERARQNYEHRNEGGFAGKRVIDLSKIGGYKKDLFYRPKDGTNHIDIIPYVVKSDKHPQKIKPGYTDYLLDVWVHRRVGPSESQFLCLKKMYGKACPICEELEELKKDPDVDESIINGMRPKRRCWYNVINLDLPERDQQIQIFEEAHYLFEKEVLEKAGVKKDNFVVFWDIEDGKSISFRATQKKSAKGNYFEYRIDDFEDRPKYKESIYKETFALDDLLVIPQYEDVKRSHNGIADDDASDQEEKHETRHESRRVRDEESEPEPKRESRRVREEEPESKRESRHDDDDDDQPSRRESRRVKDDEPPKRESRRVREEEPEPKKSKGNPCPEGYDFGHDNDKFKECSECDKDTWNECADEADRLEKRG